MRQYWSALFCGCTIRSSRYNDSLSWRVSAEFPPSAKHTNRVGCPVPDDAQFDTTMRLLAMLCFSFLAPSQGTWEATAWRLTTNSPTGDMDGEWTIRELQLYATPDCSGTKIPKIPGDSGTIPSGANTIADGDTGTWWLGCNPCHPHKEYVGLRTALTVVRTKTRRPAVF